MNSKKKSIELPKWIEFIPFKNIPTIIWMTPIITDNFIFKELKKVSLFLAIPQTGSTPNK